MMSSLFQGVTEHDLGTMLSCLGAVERKYKKNDVILLAGTKVTSVGIGQKEPHRSREMMRKATGDLLSELGRADLFAEAYVAPGCGSAGHGNRHLRLQNHMDPFSKIVGTCSSSCSFHRT